MTIPQSLYEGCRFIVIDSIYIGPIVYQKLDESVATVP